MSKEVRTFISIDIPMTDAIRGAIGSVRRIDNVRAVRPEQVHITLRFLGDTDSRKLPDLCRRMDKAFEGFPPFRITVKGMGTFPNVRNPRVVWMGIERNNALMAAASKVEDVLDSLGLDYDEKDFSPHITIGRVSGRADIKEMVESNRDTVFSDFECRTINVMGSELTPKSAVHTVIGKVELRPGH